VEKSGRLDKEKYGELSMLKSFWKNLNGERDNCHEYV